MKKTNSVFKRITSLVLSLVFVLTTFAAVDFSSISAIEAKADGEERFLMAYFTGNLQTEQQIKFAVSTDGANFKPLYGGNAVLQEKSTDTHNYDGYTYTDGVRDPYIFDGHDGYYYCIATDLEATAYGFWGSQSQMVLWRSLDLINWSDAYYINVAQICNSKRGTSFSNSDFQRTWAPEVYYENGQYMIYFALAGGDYQATRMHYMITDDLMDWTHYSAPQVLYDPGYDDIDADIIKEGSTYYMFYKDETPGRSTVCLATASDYTGPYTYVGQFETSSNTGAIEGCEVYTVGNNYYLCADRYGAAGNFAIYNMGPSLAAVAAKGSVISVSDGNPISTVEELYGFTNLTPRHGSIMHISESQYNALVAASGGVTDDDIMYNFTTTFDQNSGWSYRTYNDSSLRDIDVMVQSGGSANIVHDSGYAVLKNANLFVNDETVRNMITDDIYTISFDYSLERAAVGAPILALGDNSPEDYIMLFDNGDIWVKPSGGSDTWVANKALTLGATYHYDIVSDGTNITFYRDSEQIGKITATIDFPASGVRFVALGRTDDHTTAGYGTYSHLRFRDRAVTERELHTEFGNNLIYRRDDGTSTVDDMANVLNVSHSGDHNVVDPIVSRTAASYSLAGWVNPGATVNGNVIMGIGNNKWTPAPAGRYLAVREDGMILFNYCSGSNSGGNWSEHFVDISGAFTLSANTWSYIQINIVPISANQVKLCVWKDGVSTYSNDITLTTKIDGKNQTGNDYSYGMLGMLQLPTNYVFLGNMGVPSWWQVEGDTSYIKDVRFYTQALDPANLYQEAVDNRDAAVARDYVRANLENYNVDSNTNKATRNAYHYGRNATNGYNNVLACSTSTVCADSYYDHNWGNYKWFWPSDVVLMYDGANTPALPVAMEIKINGGTGHPGSRNVYTVFVNQSSSSAFHNAHYWTGYIDSSKDGLDRWVVWPGNYCPYNYDDGLTDYGNGANNWRTLANYTYIGYGDGAQYDYYYNFTNSGTPRHFWNKVNYQGNMNGNTAYSEHYTKINYNVYMKDDNSNTPFTDIDHNIFVVNYKPIYDILKNDESNPQSGTLVPGTTYNLKTLYKNFIKDNENNYTEDSLNQFYLAAYKVLTSNPVEYSESTYQNDFAGTVTLAANEIKEAVAEFNKINLVQRANCSYLDSSYSDAQTYISTLGASNQAYTTTSINALKQVVDGLTYAPDDGTPYRPNLAYSTHQDAIDAETNSVNSAISALDPLADLTAFDTACEDADDLLSDLVGKDPIYTKASVENLINVANASGISGEGHANKSVAEIHSADATARKDFGSAVQTDATTFKNNINSAIAALETSSVTVLKSNLEVYNEAYNRIANYDKDAYDNSEKALTDTKTTADTIVTKDTVSYDGGTINVVSNSVTAEIVDAETDVILSALSSHPKTYTITANEGVMISANGGTYYTSTGATYGTTITFSTNNAETAWYMDFGSATVERDVQYQGTGASYQVKCIGNMNVRAVSKSASTPNKITVVRKYSDKSDVAPIMLIDYVNSSYELKEAPGYAHYEFAGYYLAGSAERLDNPSAEYPQSISISGNTRIIAKYTADDEKTCLVTVNDTTGSKIYPISDSNPVAYNTKITVHDDNAAAWVETVQKAGSSESITRLFNVGSTEITFFATESATIKAIDADELEDLGPVYPIINLKQSAPEVAPSTGGKHKFMFNAQLLAGTADVQEYGILIGKAKAGHSITNDDLIIENAGNGVSDNYSIIRAKSTNLVGENQFTISLNTTMTGDYIYRAYVIYKEGDNIKQKYTDVISGNYTAS